MATFGPRFGEDDQGILSLKEPEPGIVEVFFQPSATRLKIAHRERDPKTRVLLMRFDARTDTTTLYPVNTMPTSATFLAPMDAAALADSAWRDRMKASGQSPTQAFAGRLMGKDFNGLLVRSFAAGAGEDDLNMVLWRWG